MLSLIKLVFRYFLPKMAWMTRRPIFWYKPLLEVGMPVLRAKLRLAAVTPKSVFQLNPPRFMMHSSNPVCLWALISPKVFVFCFNKRIHLIFSLKQPMETQGRRTDGSAPVSAACL